MGPTTKNMHKFLYRRSVGLKAEEQTDLENKMHMDSKLVEQIPKLPRQNNLSDNQNRIYNNQNTSDNQNDKKTGNGNGNGKREALKSGECILVVGTTGTGKSSTISKYTGIGFYKIKNNPFFCIKYLSLQIFQSFTAYILFKLNFS